MSQSVDPIENRYQILEQLGEGSMATVYKALDTRLERYAAIKVFLPLWKDSTRFLQHFVQVARTLAGFSHPNIVKVLDYGEREGLLYLITEYLSGGTLKQRLGEPIPWQEASRIIIPIANALVYVHQNEIIHRNVKPSNILMTDSGEPMLSDAGIAEIMEAEETLDSSSTGIGFGTPAYMSPEQALGERVDTRSDIYSLGVFFYEMVTGRKPFEADTSMATIMKHITAPLPMPTQFIPDLPNGVEKVISSALAKRPEDRFQYMHEFEAALRHVLDDKPAAASSVMELRPTVAAEKPASLPSRDSFFKRILKRLDGDRTTDAPPPEPRNHGN